MPTPIMRGHAQHVNAAAYNTACAWASNTTSTAAPAAAAAACPRLMAAAPAPAAGGAVDRDPHPLELFLGYKFDQPQLLQQALTYSADRARLSFAQLAFVGDAALWLLACEWLFHESAASPTRWGCGCCLPACVAANASLTATSRAACIDM